MEDDDPSAEPTPERNAPGYNKGDVLHPEWSEAPSWFGYIGVGIAFASLAIGIVGMVFVIRFLIGWFGS